MTAAPYLGYRDATTSVSQKAGQAHLYVLYECGACHRVVIAYDQYPLGPLIKALDSRWDSVVWQLSEERWRLKTLPSQPGRLSEDIPEEIRGDLREARDTAGIAPGASILKSTAAIDRMLKQRGLTEGSICARLKDALDKGLLIQEMYDWADHVREQSNVERHADLNALPSTPESAAFCYDFAAMLADLWFVLPATLKRKVAETDEGA